MKKNLVAYFSASGVTKKMAENLAKAADADLFEIEPKEIYTDADLNWMDRNSRSSVEMADRNSRPEIKSKLDIDGYDNIVLGFPIWWYREPSIIDTFLEQYDFDGKTIVPFATSGSSGIGDTSKNLQALALNARVLGGKRFEANAKIEELQMWIKSLNLGL